jgi:hypothetical protein
MDELAPNRFTRTGAEGAHKSVGVEVDALLEWDHHLAAERAKLVQERLRSRCNSLECAVTPAKSVATSPNAPSDKLKPPGPDRLQPGSSELTGSSNSVGYYFCELQKHFVAKNSFSRWCLTIDPTSCRIYDGQQVVHQVAVNRFDSTSIRNLYLMLFASGYDAAEFLVKLRNGEYENFSGFDGTTPMCTPPKL